MYSSEEFSKLNRTLRSQDNLLFWTRVLVAFTENLLLATSFKTTERILSIFKRNRAEPAPKDVVIIIDTYFTIINQISKMSDLKGRCLSQSLVMQLLLNNRGVVSEIKFGMKQSSGKLDVHAWLEIDGKPLNDHLSETKNYFIIPGKISNSLSKGI